MKRKELAINLSLSFLVFSLCLVFLEFAIRGGYAVKTFIAPKPSQGHTVPLHIVTDSPFLYGLNPDHPEISSQGLRDDEVVIPKPKGTFRILVLGDSIAYGGDVLRKNTFSERLETLLKEQYNTPIEVINSGVDAYTAYNELQYYLAKGREFDPDLVIVAACMNDVANPRLHWGHTNPNITNIPLEAIPNREYDLRHVLPKIQERRETQKLKQSDGRSSLLEYSKLYENVRWRVDALFSKLQPRATKKEPDFPTYITGEDTLSIEVLCNKSSPEWRWLTSIYDQLHEAVKEDHAALMLVIFPLAYQLDEDYPFFPQINFANYCNQNSILYIDLLNPFAKHSKRDIFLLNTNKKYLDIWHLTQYGHRVTAEEIFSFLVDNRVIENGTSTY